MCRERKIEFWVTPIEFWVMRIELGVKKLASGAMLTAAVVGRSRARRSNPTACRASARKRYRIPALERRRKCGVPALGRRRRATVVEGQKEGSRASLAEAQPPFSRRCRKGNGGANAADEAEGVGAAGAADAAGAAADTRWAEETFSWATFSISLRWKTLLRRERRRRGRRKIRLPHC